MPTISIWPSAVFCPTIATTLDVPISNPTIILSPKCLLTPTFFHVATSLFHVKLISHYWSVLSNAPPGHWHSAHPKSRFRESCPAIALERSSAGAPSCHEGRRAPT